MARYRNRDTGQVVEYPGRSARLDALAYRWERLDDDPERGPGVDDVRPGGEGSPDDPDVPVVDPDGDPDEAPAEVPVWPGARAAKPELIDYVVARQLLDRAAAQALTRTQLIDRYRPADPTD